ncbi:MAG: thioredoxin domain-containing protein [Akkermansiaceae bacterium]|nr:thioredoxin domain-containing protein [Akkermansiaceae bacterium]
MRNFCIILAVVGVLLSAVLLAMHVPGTVDDGGLLGSVCGEGGGCDRVLASRWSMFPPVEAAVPVFRVPVALPGLFYFTALALWFAAGGGASRAVLAGLAAGNAASVAFLTIMFVVVKGVCPFCLATHGTNFALLATVWLGRSGLDADAERFAGRRGWVVAVAACLWLAQGLGWRAASVAAENRSLREALAAIQSDTDRLEAAFLGAEKREIALRDEESRPPLAESDYDPAIAPAPGYRNTLVIFGDAECPSCRRFHELLNEKIRPAFAGHLRVVFKHFPLDDRHPHARRAALALEAARGQGRFVEMLEALHAVQDELADVDLVALAESLGMDGTAFAAAMDSPEAARRVVEDVALGKALGVSATPAVFLNGRPVASSIRNVPGFWALQADRLREYRERKGQGWGGERMAETAPRAE